MIAQSQYIWLDSLAAISRIQDLRPRAGQWLARRIYDKVNELQSHKVKVCIHWIPGHTGIKGNEMADMYAKEAAAWSRKCPEEFITLSHIKRTITERQHIECRQWFTKEHHRRNPVTRITYKLDLNTKSVNPVAFRAKNILACRYFQLKSQHAVTAEYLFRISRQSCDLCEWCGKRERQTVRHLMLDCRKWRKERRIMWKQIRNDNGWADNGTGIVHLFADRRATAGVLKFLEQTEVGR